MKQARVKEAFIGSVSADRGVGGQYRSRSWRWRLLLVATMIGSGLTAGPVAARAMVETSDSKKNVVLIVADDLGWRDLHCTGSEFYESPNLDALAGRSMRFQQGYAACQVCSPSRVAIVTGKFPARLKTTDWFGAAAGTQWKRNTRLLPAEYNRSIPQEELTLAEAFSQNGYKTFFAGKWHMGGEGSLPEDHGFQENVGGHHRGSPPGGFFSPYSNPKMDDGPDGESLPLRLGHDTAKFIRENHQQPFFAMLAFYSVHAPLQTTEELWDKYRAKALAGATPDHRFIIDRTLLPVRQVQDHPVYAGMIEAMDAAIGIVLDELESQGIADQTIVVFTSDNGGVSAGDAKATSNLPFRGGKGRQWEGGIREPFFVFVPNLTTGADSQTPVISTDLYPTLMELCDLPLQPQQHVDGVSLVPALEGNPLVERPLFWHYPHYGNQGGEPSSIIRRGNDKLIYYHEDQRVELYDLAADVGEQNDLATEKPELSQKLQNELLAWLKSIDADMPTVNPDFSAEQERQSMQQLIDKGLPNLERQHAAFLNQEYQPNKDWWGSSVRD